MTVHLSRDYVQTTTAINVQQAGVPYYSCTLYQLAIYLYRVLGYSIIGATGFNLDTMATSINVAAMTTGIPFQVTTSTPHGFAIGSPQGIQISNSLSSVGNGAWTIVPTGTDTFDVRGFNPSTYTSGAIVTAGFLYASGKTIDGEGAGINFGAGVNFEVSIPGSVRVVSVADIGKILVLKSVNFPTKNSGLFKISGINTGSNRYIIDYRATEVPPAESANSIDWWLYEAENVAANQMYVDTFWNNPSANISAATNTSPVTITGVNGNGSHNLFTGQNVTIEGALGNTAINGDWTITVLSSTTFQLNGSSGNGTYTGNGSFFKSGYPGYAPAATTRIILQSPHSTAWQVRICLEPRNANLPPFSITTGFNGTSDGDFPIGSPQTHITEYFNINSFKNTTYVNAVPGQGDNTIGQRVSFAGDDSGQYFFMFTRPVSGVRSYGITVVGIPDNEPAPLPSNEERVFVYSPNADASSGNNAPGGTALRLGASPGNVGMTMKGGIPKFAALTGWANLDGATTTTPFFSSNAGDSPFTNSTEVLPIEVWAGTYVDVQLSTAVNRPFYFDPRYLGTSPLLRLGRSNFSSTPSLTSEEVTSRTIIAATNASPIQITTSVANALVTGQTVTIHGVQGNTAANGTWIITRIDNTNFTLNGSTGNGNYTSGGTVNGCAGWIHLTNGLYMIWNGPSGITA